MLRGMSTSSSSSSTSLASSGEYVETSLEMALGVEVPPGERRLLEYWKADGLCPKFGELMTLLDYADNPDILVRRRPLSPRMSNVQFPFDVPEQRARLRQLLVENRKYYKRVRREIRHAVEDNLETLELPQLSVPQYELVRAIACVAGIENYARCRPVETHCTTFLPVGMFAPIVRCGCAFAPLELKRSTAVYLKQLSNKDVPGSEEEKRVLDRLCCASIADYRKLYYGEAIVDGVVLMFERKRTPRTPREEPKVPRVQISRQPSRNFDALTPPPEAPTGVDEPSE